MTKEPFLSTVVPLRLAGFVERLQHLLKEHGDLPLTIHADRFSRNSRGELLEKTETVTATHFTFLDVDIYPGRRRDSAILVVRAPFPPDPRPDPRKARKPSR